MKKKVTIIATAAFLAAALSFAGEPVRWLNVHVVSHKDNAKVDVRVPMNLVA
ncbi:MAG: hypothetical protein GXP48_06520, partial [Acidobacteria bacterium]|nr:hypothetical protein [Acidobacteriota bacterium]